MLFQGRFIAILWSFTMNYVLTQYLFKITNVFLAVINK